MNATNQVFVRLGVEHIANLVAVERESFLAPWSKDDLRDLLMSAGVVSYGILIRGKLAAYGLGYSELEQFHLASMAVAPEFRRQGLGKALLHCLLREAKDLNCTCCTLEVRANNRIAQNLYSQCGFIKIRHMVDHYDDPKEDGLELSLVVL